jgi:hypothetical protein
MTETHELAVMCDTLYEEPGGSPTTADEDPAGVTSHF